MVGGPPVGAAVSEPRYVCDIWMLVGPRTGVCVGQLTGGDGESDGLSV